VVASIFNLLICSSSDIGVKGKKEIIKYHKQRT